MTARSMFSPIISIQVNNTVSATKVIIETRVAGKSIRINMRGYFKRLQQYDITQ